MRAHVLIAVLAVFLVWGAGLNWMFSGADDTPEPTPAPVPVEAKGPVPADRTARPSDAPMAPAPRETASPAPRPAERVQETRPPVVLRPAVVVEPSPDAPSNAAAPVMARQEDPAPAPNEPAQPTMARKEDAAPAWTVATRAPAQPAASAPQAPPPSVTPKIVLRVTGSIVNVRAAPGLEEAKLTSYERDTLLELVERRGEWVRVRHPETREEGWMFATYLEELQPSATAGPSRW